MRRRDHQSGFSTTVILLAVLVVAVLAVTGLVVYQHHKPSSAKNSAAANQTQTTTTQPQSTTTTQTQQAATLATYTSTYGGFSFQYPSGWKVTEGQYPAGAGTTVDQINISAKTGVPVVNGEATIADVISMGLFVSPYQDAYMQSSAIPNGTVQKLTNGIDLWVSDTAHSAYTEHSGTTVSCPTMRIVNTDSTHFGYPLANGKYLGLDGSYCGGQASLVDLTYQQQLASPDWQAAVAIIQSIKFQ